MEALMKLEKVVKSMGVDEDSWQAMSTCWSSIDIGRKQVLTRQGEVEKYIYFVLEGVQRAYVEHRDKDATLVFSYEGSFSGIVDSFLLQSPSKYFLETITSSSMLRMHYNDYTRLISEYRSVDSWVRNALTHTLAGTLERNIELLSFSAEERFKILLTRSPHVLNLIPHKYLASYIGVDPTTFSKLLGKVRL